MIGRIAQLVPQGANFAVIREEDGALLVVCKTLARAQLWITRMGFAVRQ